MASHHLAEFGGHRHSGSGVTMVLVCHKISQDRITKESCNFMGGTASQYVTTLSSLVAIGIMIVAI